MPPVTDVVAYFRRKDTNMPEEAPETDYEELEEEPSETAAAVIRAAMAHRPLKPPGK